MVKPVTQAEQDALSTHKLNPHPDGKPWVKCCRDSKRDNDRSCQCFMKKPRGRPSRFEYFIRWNSPVAKKVRELAETRQRFFCVHRKDGDYHRECAGWAAKFKTGENHG